MLSYLLAATAVFTASATAQGCGIDHDPGYHGPFSISSGGKTRYYKVQVPSTYNANFMHTLIFDYHGHNDTPDDQHDNSMYQNYDAASHYLIIYPQGINNAWQGAPYAEPDVNSGKLDLQFTAGLLEHIKQNYCIDSNRVYASGKSNGGGFVDTLACSDIGDQLAAFAMASAALYAETSEGSCTKKRAILESHGDGDDVIRYGAGLSKGGGDTPNIGEWVRWWGERNCGASAPSSTNDDNGYNVTTFSCNGLDDVVTHYRFDTLGHCWPNSEGDNYDAQKQPKHCGDVRVLDFTPVVLAWFGRWTLQNAPH